MQVHRSGLAVQVFHVLLSICQSNEVEDEQGIIKVHKGLIIVLETKD